jgi:hypothetical protein
MIDYIIDLVKVKRPTATPQAPISLTLESMEASKRYRQFFQEGNLYFEFPRKFNEQNSTPSPYYHSLEGQGLCYVGWKQAYPTVPLYCFECRFNSDEKVDCHLVHDRHNWSKNNPCFPFGPFLECLRGVYLLSTRVPRSAKISMRRMMGAFCGFLEADVSNSYLVLPNYANGTFHFHKDRPDGRLHENVRE